MSLLPLPLPLWLHHCHRDQSQPQLHYAVASFFIRVSWPHPSVCWVQLNLLLATQDWHLPKMWTDGNEDRGGRYKEANVHRNHICLQFWVRLELLLKSKNTFPMASMMTKVMVWQWEARECEWILEGGSPGGACIFVVFVVTPPSARVFPDCISSYVAVSELVWFGKST